MSTWALLCAAIVVLAATLLLFASRVKPRCLVVVLAETRAHKLTWSSFERNVLKPLDADLALCVGSRGCTEDDPFFKNAKYTWAIDEPSDWGDAYDEAQAHMQCGGNWRDILKIKDQLFGGIADPEHAHPGSAGILLFFRFLLLHNLRASGALREYTHFVITRSDHYYELPHPAIDFSDHSSIMVPEGEDYGGITDRHMVVPRRHLASCLDVLSDLLCDSSAMLRQLSMQGANWNLEKYLLYHYTKRGVARHIRRFERVMYAVRLEDTTTRWSVGEYHPEAGMIVKYRGEYDAVQRTKRARAEQTRPL